MPGPTADAVNDILRGVQEPGGFGYSAGLNLAQPSAGKTGTTTATGPCGSSATPRTSPPPSMIAGANPDGTRITLNGQTVGGPTSPRRSARRWPARCGATR